jgi:hypothetical protein
MATSRGMGDTLRDRVAEAERELSRLITYINDEVVPEVRRTSAVGLRVAAEQLGRMAEQLDRGQRGRSRADQGAASVASAQASR